MAPITRHSVGNDDDNTHTRFSLLYIIMLYNKTTTTPFRYKKKKPKRRPHCANLIEEKKKCFNRNFSALRL